MTTPTLSFPAAPPRSATASAASAQARGFTPPALAMTFTPRPTTAGRTLSMAPRKSRAYPIFGSRSFCFWRIDIVTSAR